MKYFYVRIIILLLSYLYKDQNLIILIRNIYKKCEILKNQIKNSVEN